MRGFCAPYIIFMPHAIIKTLKNLDDVDCVDIFRYKNNGILPLQKPLSCFLDIYKKQDLMIIKLNKIIRSIITDELKNTILEISKKIANCLNAEIIFHNLEPNNTHKAACACLEDIYPQKKPILLANPINNLEIGFGRGEFLFSLAEQKSHEFFYGIEIYGKDYLIALSRCCDKKLKNVKLLNYDAKYAIDLFEDNSFNNIYVNFPEPWFKLYRIAHSIFNKITFEKITDKIKLGGLLHVITDNYPFAVHTAVIAHYFGLKPKDNFFIKTQNYFDTLYAKKWKRLKRIFYRLDLQKTHITTKSFYRMYNFPVKLAKLDYKYKGLIFKILREYENKNFDYKIIEVAIGNYLAQHVFFGFSNGTIFLLPQTNFIYTKDFCEALEKVAI